MAELFILVIANLLIMKIIEYCWVRIRMISSLIKHFSSINPHLSTGPYLHKRYFGIAQNLPSMLSVTTKYIGTILNIGLDCHEAKFHSKFSNKENKCTHIHLQNWNEGTTPTYIVNRVFFFPEIRINLQFEIRLFSPEIQMEGSFVNKFRNKETCERFRLWSFVSAREVNHIPFVEVIDETGSFYVSDTRFYVPWWLRSDKITLQNEILPKDQAPNKNIIVKVHGYTKPWFTWVNLFYWVIFFFLVNLCYRVFQSFFYKKKYGEYPIDIDPVKSTDQHT